MAFSSIGKEYKGISGGFTFDHKADFSKKTAFGSVGGDLTSKGENYPATAKATYKLPSAASLDASVTDAGKVALTLTKVDVAYAFAKTPAIGGKLALTSVCTVGKQSVLSSVGWSSGSLLLGGEAEFSYAAGKSGLSKYTLGAQTTLPNGGVGSALLVEAKTLKVAYVQKVSTITAGAELVYPLQGAGASGTLAASTKLANGATAKATVTSKSVVSLLYSAEVQKNATVTFAVALDTVKLDTPKYGVQLSMKV